MDFSQVKSITIPEGDVIKIMNGSTVLWEKQLLPDGYMRVGWLESDGNQWIDTGVALDSNTRIVARFYAGAMGTNTCGILGARNSNNGTQTTMLFYIGENSVSAGRIMAYHNIISSFFNFSNTTENTEYELDFNKNVVTLNGYVRTFVDQVFTSTNNIYLFTVNNNGIPDQRIMLGKFYYCQIYNDGTLVADLQPCIRLSDGKPGMYDLVMRQFLTNQGTGDFTAGPEAT